MIIGIDEVGRGCWAGPLVAAAVALPLNHAIDGLVDSKKLSAKKRTVIANEIRSAQSDIGIGWVWPTEINQLGLSKSVQLAMQRAFNELAAIDHQEVIIDGSINFLSHLPKTKAVIKADGSIPEVSAASIVAKVARDEYMIEVAKKYPHYGFEKHVGYGTALHVAALKEFGVLPLHRTSYKPIRAML